MLLRPQYEKPVDSVQDIIERGLIPFVNDDNYYIKDFLSQSPNPLFQQLGEMTVVPTDYEEFIRMIKEQIQGANTHVLMTLLHDYDYESSGFIKSDFHKSKDYLEGNNPFGVNILNKKWEHSAAYDHHLLLYTQVGKL